MKNIKEYFRIRKLKKEIKKHDKSYIDKRYISIDNETGLPIYKFQEKK